MSYRGMMDGWHGDEHIIEAEYREQRKLYEEQRADEWRDDPENWD